MCTVMLYFMTIWIAICSFPFGNRCHKWKHECSWVQCAKTRKLPNKRTHFAPMLYGWRNTEIERKNNAPLSSLHHNWNTKSPGLLVFIVYRNEMQFSCSVRLCFRTLWFHLHSAHAYYALHTLSNKETGVQL